MSREADELRLARIEEKVDDLTTPAIRKTTLSLPAWKRFLSFLSSEKKGE